MIADGVGVGVGFCTSCGEQLVAGNGFCTSCGAPVGGVAPVSAPPAPLWPVDEPSRGPLRGRRRLAGLTPGIRAGLARNWLGLLVSILCAWFGVPLALLIGTIGAIVGAVAGALSGSVMGDSGLERLNVFVEWIFPLPVPVAELVPTAAWQIGGIVGAIIGGVAGGVHMFALAMVWPWQAMYASDPALPVQVGVGQVLVALVVGGLYLVWSTVTEDARLRIGGARRPSRREKEFLEPLLKEVAAGMGLQVLPTVLVDDSREVNAVAHSRHVVVNRGLLEHLQWDREAVTGVLAHEVAHWRHGDTITNTLLKGVSLPLYLGFEAATRMQARARFKPLQWMLTLLLWGVTATVRYVVIPVQARCWRRMESAADAAAGAAGFGAGLHTALAAIGASFDGSRSGWDEAICRTHPATELRLEALEGHGGKAVELGGDAVPGLAGAAPSASSASTMERGW